MSLSAGITGGGSSVVVSSFRTPNNSGVSGLVVVVTSAGAASVGAGPGNVSAAISGCLSRTVS